MTAKRYPVLHIDDDPAITRLVTSLLCERGIEATELNDPTQALDVIVKHSYRVVLLDLDMPDINGVELLAKIKRLDGGINVIVLTGLISQATALTVMRRGALTCLFKPLNDFSPLLDAVQIAFDNTNRWWDTLKALAEMRSRESQSIKQDLAYAAIDP